MRRKIVVGLAASLFAMSCTSEGDRPASGGSKLGIKRFVVEETADLTTVRGLDAAGNEVGRMSLLHGRYTMSPYFAEGIEDPNVVGRKLQVVVKDQELNWETIGFDPVLKMPSHPPSHWMVAAFLDDLHVAPVLGRWQIGFQDAGSEVGYTWMTGESSWGYDPYTCTSTSCGTVGSNNINTCGQNEASVAVRITTDDENYAYDYHQVGQCCPAVGQLPSILGHKTCPTGGTTHPCGTISGSQVCNACASYNTVNNNCNVWTQQYGSQQVPDPSQTWRLEWAFDYAGGGGHDPDNPPPSCGGLGEACCPLYGGSCDEGLNCEGGWCQVPTCGSYCDENTPCEEGWCSNNECLCD